MRYSFKEGVKNSSFTNFTNFILYTAFLNTCFENPTIPLREWIKGTWVRMDIQMSLFDFMLVFLTDRQVKVVIGEEGFNRLPQDIIGSLPTDPQLERIYGQGFTLKHNGIKFTVGGRTRPLNFTTVGNCDFVESFTKKFPQFISNDTYSEANIKPFFEFLKQVDDFYSDPTQSVSNAPISEADYMNLLGIETIFNSNRLYNGQYEDIRKTVGVISKHSGVKSSRYFKILREYEKDVILGLDKGIRHRISTQEFLLRAFTYALVNPEVLNTTSKLVLFSNLISSETSSDEMRGLFQRLFTIELMEGSKLKLIYKNGSYWFILYDKYEFSWNNFLDRTIKFRTNNVKSVITRTEVIKGLFKDKGHFERYSVNRILDVIPFAKKEWDFGAVKEAVSVLESILANPYNTISKDKAREVKKALGACTKLFKEIK